MIKYIFLTYRLISITFRYIFIDKNNKNECAQFYNEFLTLGIIPVKICQWVINYTYHINVENKSLLFELFYNNIMNKCIVHDLKYSDSIISKYNLKIDNLELLNSGSIGQVYKGKWENKIVAVKILHPEVNETISYWFYILKTIFFILKYTNNLKKLNLDWDSLDVYFKSQFDFREEGKNLEKFNEYYKNNQYVIIPKSYFYEKDILIMEYVESTNLDFIEQNCSKYLLSKISSFLTITLEDMFQYNSYLHGDFHGGNYGIILNEKSFKIVIYDLGLVIKNSTNILNIFMSTLYETPELFTDSFINIFHVDKKFKEKVKPLIEQQIKYGNITFNDMLKDVIKNGGNIKISLESIFLITTFLNTEKFRKVNNKSVINKISIMEEFNCYEKFCNNLISFYFNDDKSFLEDLTIKSS